MIDVISYSAAFFLGLLGGVHCVGMCGGIMSALSFSIPESKRSFRNIFPLLLAYNAGRLLSYTIIGALVGYLAWMFTEGSQQLGFILRIFSGIMLIIMGLYVARWWLGLSYLESLGANVWKYIQPFGQRLMPVTNVKRAVLLGAIWGWLPCGLVYSVATWAASASDWQQSALIMLSFGLGTLPILLVTGHFAVQLKKVIQSKKTQAIVASVIILFGVWTIVGALIYSGDHDAHSGHMSHEIQIDSEFQTDSGLIPPNHTRSDHTSHFKKTVIAPNKY